jgi:hypothetical protein
MIVLLSHLLLELIPILFYETKISSIRLDQEYSWVGQEESSKLQNFDAVDLGLLGG